MNNVIQTQFSGKNPFKPKRKVTMVDVTTLRITEDKPKKKTISNYKYDALFNGLDIGKSLACKSEDCDKVAQALRSYITRHNKPWFVKGQMYYTPKTARVFVLGKNPK